MPRHCSSCNASCCIVTWLTPGLVVGLNGVGAGTGVEEPVVPQKQRVRADRGRMRVKQGRTMSQDIMEVDQKTS